MKKMINLQRNGRLFELEYLEIFTRAFLLETII